MPVDRRTTAATLLAATLIIPPLAAAQESPAQVAQAQPAEAPSSSLEEVVVTARFKTENIQQAPIAVTALSGDQMEARGYTNITNLSASAPNVNLEQGTSGYGKSAFVSIAASGRTTSSSPSSRASASISTTSISRRCSARSSI